ncbi:Dolichyl-P-Man:Man(5)GlcNAc(2)-PP-dolichyl mannosyltransferase [Echinococcus granulosus]|uniref:dolichyl-P-Man:Man5GlcNAc2-PP-dolichol alpha-1,3-mannosyltransferase n=1 Tax=Echinococcus granulosus TaxID=6210 RepID=W6UP87_ECHGR|nr:Dolichyl-P-Man:Man(5)GlcNAc(2)-PP-dolichyl mannosyltransferase [Echinococcus granulosus]XP_024351300.1 Dolichyl-P-Man:Man(5)GlcNAc(2)-PP-dolichyl mannosyltransferase [Echinococcus granulosus]EUB60097.1 Dolichyl-P-Man:Man(5)GlcNAc(2)-PP-dolichyl mannosyltransferase [Echinococcus granulosus]EUB60104.1 Dolichyl-P-Man:Man(5)GlcNAc(2)-PP-dolichyl mannosyltransferase [Echinococcus granulosus]
MFMQHVPLCNTLISCLTHRFDLRRSKEVILIGLCQSQKTFIKQRNLIFEMPTDTEIDWVAYMQQSEVFLNGTRDYDQLIGRTGPCVSCGGFKTFLQPLPPSQEQKIIAEGRLNLPEFVYFAFVILVLLQICFTFRCTLSDVCFQLHCCFSTGKNKHAQQQDDIKWRIFYWATEIIFRLRKVVKEENSEISVPFYYNPLDGALKACCRVLQVWLDISNARKKFTIIYKARLFKINKRIINWFQSNQLDATKFRNCYT